MTTMTTDNRVSRLITTDDADGAAGAICYWSMTEVSPSALHAALRDAGIPDEWRPELPGDGVLLHRACQRVASAHLLVRSLDGAHWLVEERATNAGPSYTTLGWVRLSGDEASIAPEVPESLRLEVQREWRNVRRFTGADLGSWMVSLVGRRLDGVALRDRGGVYFVPRDRRSLLDAIAGAMKRVACRLHIIPAMRSDQAMESIIAAIDAEAKQAVAEITEYLSKQAATVTANTADNARAAKALKTREDVLDATAAKLARYTAMFDGKVVRPIHARIAAVRARLSGAPMVLPTCDHDDCWEEASGGMGTVCRLERKAN